MIDVFGGQPKERFACSRAGCSQPADWAIVWRNPKIHAENRRKTWLACREHLEYLREFLSARSFPIKVIAIDELSEDT